MPTQVNDYIGLFPWRMACGYSYCVTIILIPKHFLKLRLIQLISHSGRGWWGKCVCSLIEEFTKKIRDGRTTRFLGDTWLGDTPLALQYPSLYNIVQQKEVYVATILGTISSNIQFGRALIWEKWTAWLDLVGNFMSINLTNELDAFHWRLSSSVYSWLNLCMSTSLIHVLYFIRSTFRKSMWCPRLRFSCGLCIGG